MSIACSGSLSAPGRRDWLTPPFPGPTTFHPGRAQGAAWLLQTSEAMHWGVGLALHMGSCCCLGMACCLLTLATLQE